MSVLIGSQNLCFFVLKVINILILFEESLDVFPKWEVYEREFGYKELDTIWPNDEVKCKKAKNIIGQNSHLR